MQRQYKRPQYASQIADAALGRSILSSSMLCLGSPHGTGKSTFLTTELTPCLEGMGALVLYVDLWKNKEQDPAELIAFAIGNALARSQGFIAKAAQGAGLSKVSIQGIEFSLDAIGKQPGATIADALMELRGKAAKQIVFIIDEAQHAISSEQGMNAMFSLKSARDTINTPSEVGLGLVLSGSDRDKLLRLVNGNAFPFMGSSINELPALDKGFTDYIAGLLAVQHPLLQIDNGRLFKAFQRFNHRPEELFRAIGNVVGAFGVPAGGNFNDLLDQGADEYEADLYEGYANAYGNLTKLQQAVLTRVLSHGRTGQLYNADALSAYGKAHGKRVLAGAARSAVEKLRMLDPPLIWKSIRGEYAAEDSGMRTWYASLMDAGSWPPR